MHNRRAWEESIQLCIYAVDHPWQGFMTFQYCYIVLKCKCAWHCAIVSQHPVQLFRFLYHQWDWMHDCHAHLVDQMLTQTCLHAFDPYWTFAQGWYTSVTLSSLFLLCTLRLDSMQECMNMQHTCSGSKNVSFWIWCHSHGCSEAWTWLAIEIVNLTQTQAH